MGWNTEGDIVTANPPHRSPPDFFLKLWDAERLTSTLARHVLKLGWTADDESRMRELSARNSVGSITDTERRELDRYLEVGLTFSILHSRARQVLKGRVAGP